MSNGDIPGLYAKVYVSFNKIPDKVLNSNQKIVLQSFMIFSHATKILKQLGLIDNKFQLPIGIVAELSGLSRYQAQNAIKALPAAVKEINKRKLLAKGESLKFEIKDEDGNNVAESGANKTGQSYWYFFKYICPRETAEINGVTDSTADEDNEDPVSTGYDSGVDPHYQDKYKEIIKLEPYFHLSEMEKFYKYTLDEIVQGVDHYLISLKEKQDNAQAAGRDREKVQLNYIWFKRCMEEKWYLTKYTPRQKVKQEIERIKILIAKVRSFTTDEKIKHPLKLLHDKKPLHKYTQFENIAMLNGLIYKEYKEIPDETKKEIYNLAAKFYRFEKKKHLSKQDPVVYDEKIAKERLQQIITVAYLNFV